MMHQSFRGWFVSGSGENEERVDQDRSVAVLGSRVVREALV